MIVQCSFCEKDLKRKPSQVKKRKNHFCDKICFGKWNSENKKGENHPNYKRVIVNCSFCNKPITIKNYQFEQNENHFCDKECQGKWNSQNKVGKDHPTYSQVNKICQHCGQTYSVAKYREKISLYCSEECKRENKKNKIQTKCANCGETVYKTPSTLKEYNFCSNKCVGEWNGKQRDRKVDKICIICGKPYRVQPAHAEKSITCSVECQKIWQKEYYYKQPEVLEFRRQISIKTISKQKTKGTKPEIIVEDFLLKNNIVYIPQHPMYNKFVVDFYLPKHNIIIEVLGDYWHGNPNKYGDEESKKSLSEKQIKTRNKDKIRFEYLSKNHKIYGVWESDIYESVENALSFLI